MIFPLNAYGGLSANQVLSLFGAQSPPASSSSPSTSTGLAANPVATSGGSDPIAAIKALVTQSRIVQTSTNGQRSFVAQAEAAYAEQTVDAGATGDSNEPSTTNVRVEDISTTTTSVVLPNGKSELSSRTDRRDLSDGLTLSSFSSVTLAPQGSPSSSDATLTTTDAAIPPSSSTHIELASSITKQTADGSGAIAIDIGFSVDDLDLSLTPGAGTLSAHTADTEHSYGVTLQIDTYDHGVGQSLCMPISGLTAAQAQDIVAGFNNAGAAANIQQEHGDGVDISYSAGSYRCLVNWS